MLLGGRAHLAASPLESDQRVADRFCERPTGSPQARASHREHFTAQPQRERRFARY